MTVNIQVGTQDNFQFDTCCLKLSKTQRAQNDINEKTHCLHKMRGGSFVKEYIRYAVLAQQLRAVVLSKVWVHRPRQIKVPWT